MKAILIAVLTILSFSLISQTEIKQGTYRFTSNELETFSPQTDTTGTSQCEIHAGHQIKVLHYSSEKNLVYYRYIPFKKVLTSYDKKNGRKINKVFKESTYGEVYNGNIYMMPTSSFNLMTEPLYSRYKGALMGVYTVPFRIRDIGGDNFDFETSLSLQANLIFGWGTKRNANSWFDASCGIGITGVTLDSRNTNIPDTIPSRTASALTISLGTVFKPSPTTSIGFFFGWDFLGAKDKEVEWVHQGNMWLGVGIGISLSPLKSEKPATGKQKQNN